MAKDEKFQKGHRERLRRRLVERGWRSLADYELLEVMLFRVFPRGDVKPLAKTLLKQLGSFAEVVTAPSHRLLEIDGVGDRVAEDMIIEHALITKFNQSRIENRPLLTSWEPLIDYCNAMIGYEPVEKFHALYLDNKGRLIEDNEMQKGTVDRAVVYPREIAKRGLHLESKSVILVHNHPSGDPTPSREDIQLTERIRKSLRLVDMELQDHLIVSRGRHISLKTLGLISDRRAERD